MKTLFSILFIILLNATSFAQEKKVTYFYLSCPGQSENLGLRIIYTTVQSTTCYADTDKYRHAKQADEIENQMHDYLKAEYEEYYKYTVHITKFDTRGEAEIERRREMGGSKNANFRVISDKDFVYYCDEE